MKQEKTVFLTLNRRWEKYAYLFFFKVNWKTKEKIYVDMDPLLRIRRNSTITTTTTTTFTFII